MRMELAIEGKPNIRVFPQYAFLDAITNNETTNREKICSIYIGNASDYKWKYDYLEAKIEIISDVISIYRKGYGVKPIGGIFCECDDFEEMIFNIEYMQYTNIWDKIVFFYDTRNSSMFSDDDFCTYEFSIHCCGDWRVDASGKNIYYKINRNEGEIPKWYKIRKQANRIQLYYSSNDMVWVEINDATLEDFGDRNAKLGFYIHLYENQYQKWVCNNFIQIKYDKREGKPIDYVGLMNRDWKNYAINPLVKFSYDKRKLIRWRGLWSYIVDNIRCGRYLEIWLNEYYIEGLDAYKKYSYVHESLIYGFDEMNRIISLMSFKEGKPILIKAPIDTIEMAWNNAPENNHIVHTFEFGPDGKGYEIDIDYICNMIKDYLEGRNSSKDFQYIAEIESGFFGKTVYTEILSDADNRKRFLKDVRIAYLFKEHKECMRFRIDFLYEYGALNAEVYFELKEGMENIVKNANIVLALVIKNRLAASEQIQNCIWGHINALSALEDKYYHILLKELKRFLLQKQSNICIYAG